VRVEWRPRATEDLDVIVDYIAVDSPNTALIVLDRITRRIAMLADQPMLGRPGRISGTRELVINRTPYLAAYRVIDERVIILSIVHGARRWPLGFG
jgi:addiction module RelE/StbE family toxin